MAELRRWYVAIALFVALILDGVLAYNLQTFIFHRGFSGSCWLTIIGITLISLCDDKNDGDIWLCLGLGLIADLYYLGIIGIYTVAFPLICFIIQQSARFLPEVFWFRLLICLVTYLCVSAYVFLMFNMVGIIQLSFASFSRSILPNLLWCLILVLCTYWFWVKLAEEYPFLKKEYYF
jgi:rod shape-determining protein MreD